MGTMRRAADLPRDPSAAVGMTGWSGLLDVEMRAFVEPRTPNPEPHALTPGVVVVPGVDRVVYTGDGTGR